MDYEKKYKEALERAKELYEKRNNSCFVQDQIKGEAALKIFPEIKENKDILKILIQIFQTQYRDSTYSAFPYEGLITGEEILAWLEKQGEKKFVDMNDIKEKAHQIAWETSKHYDPNACKQEWCEMAALDMASLLEKQCEQKSDKVEPKFKVGDWVIYNYPNTISPLCIIRKTEDNIIELQDTKGRIFQTEIEDLKTNYTLLKEN